LIDIHSDTWIEVKAYCERERESLMQELIAGTERDDKVRGQILFIDDLLNLATPKEKKPIPAPNYL